MNAQTASVRPTSTSALARNPQGAGRLALAINAYTSGASAAIRLTRPRPIAVRVRRRRSTIETSHAPPRTLPRPLILPDRSSRHPRATDAGQIPASSRKIQTAVNVMITSDAMMSVMNTGMLTPYGAHLLAPRTDSVRR